MKTKPATEIEDPAALVEQARAELQDAESALSALNIHAGKVEDVVRRRRELFEAVEVCRERLEVATARADAVEYEKTSMRIAELSETAAELENEIEAERDTVSAELRRFLNPAWLDGVGRFSSSPPAMGTLLGFSVSVNAIAERLDAVHAEIRRLENSIRERRAQRDRERRAECVEARRRLLAGESVAVELVPWRIVPLGGCTSECARRLAQRAIPAAIPPETDAEIHALLPGDSQPGAYLDEGAVLHAGRMDPSDLCPAMAEIFKRSRG